MKVVIIDYGMGNIKSISSTLKYIGVDEVLLSNKESDIYSADKLLLPGVGSFSKAIHNIKELNLDKYLFDAVVLNKKPILGICLGMQIMAETSDEDGKNKGLGFISGAVKKFNIDRLKIPHVGFNQVKTFEVSKLYRNIDDLSDFYFTHSYRMTGSSEINPAFCDYGEVFIASYEVENIAGVQFHPELSQYHGLTLLKNFVESF